MTDYPRIVEPEWLDDLPSSDPRALSSRRDLARLNAVMLQPRLMGRMLKAVPRADPPRTILDLGSGDGVFMLRVAASLSKHWPGVTLFLLDRQACSNPDLRTRFARFGWTAEPVAMDVFDFLKSTRWADIITANLFLHHFSSEPLAQLLALAAQRTRLFAACEPRRAPLALGGSRLVGLLGCNAVTRHDAVASVRAGFRGRELSALWPDGPGWRLSEHRAGLFSHGFTACHAD